MQRISGGASFYPTKTGFARLGFVLMASAAIWVTAGFDARVSAQQAAQRSYSVPAGSLGAAVARFGDSAGLQILYPAELVRGKQSQGVSGTMTREAALSNLLSGTGLTYRFTNANTVTIIDPAAADSSGADGGSTTLQPIVLRKGGRDAGVSTPYETAAATNYIDQEQIERYRGASPADIFRGTPGVMSGEARNGAGSVDVNIRGLQGMGRVKTTIDGAENEVQIYQGYQGISNRTYVDPDLLAGVDITKGSDAASSGIAGTVAMRTVDAADIVDEGKTFGMKVKGGFQGNTSDPVVGHRSGYSFSNILEGYPIVTESANGMDRPNFLQPTDGSASVIGAMRTETVDLLAGYAYRKQGNYHAGKNGPSAKPVYLGQTPFCYPSGECPYNYYDYVVNGGLADYRAGEEVLNTQQESKSFIAKGTVRFGEGHSIQIGYNGYRSEAGSTIASAMGTPQASGNQLRSTSTELDTGTFKYRWNPDDNELIDLKANFWVTDLKIRYPYSVFIGGIQTPVKEGPDTLMWGGEITNKSAFSFDSGSLDLDYGVSYKSEDTEPSDGYNLAQAWLPIRDAIREEAGAYIKASYKPAEFDWLTINGGLRYSHYWTHDRAITRDQPSDNSKPNRDEGGFSPSVGVTVEPFDNVQLYANYSSTLRFPSTFESISAFTIIPNPDLGPERANNWEIGTNICYDGLISEGDKAMVKFGYFNWTVDDYIARAFREFQGPGYIYQGMQVYNIDKAKFSGLELSARYENNGFTAQLGANYYLNVEYCQLNGDCEGKTMYGDYATNHVPPEYSADLTMSQKFLDEKLTVGGRVSYFGPRAIGHGQVTQTGLSQFISQVKWEPFTLVDVFAEYKINETFTASLRVDNVFDRYYVDPLGLVTQPGPGRTFYASLTAKF